MADCRRKLAPEVDANPVTPEQSSPTVLMSIPDSAALDDAASMQWRFPSCSDFFLRVLRAVLASAYCFDGKYKAWLFLSGVPEME